MKTTNKKAAEMVNWLQEFRASHLHAEWLDKYYIVYSYRWWPLYIYNDDLDEWYENSDRYSVSTSRHRNQARPDSDTKLMTREEMVRMVYYPQDALC